MKPLRQTYHASSNRIAGKKYGRRFNRSGVPRTRWMMASICHHHFCRNGCIDSNVSTQYAKTLAAMN